MNSRRVGGHRAPWLDPVEPRLAAGWVIFRLGGGGSHYGLWRPGRVLGAAGEGRRS
jgi:hypothetical protein